MSAHLSTVERQQRDGRTSQVRMRFKLYCSLKLSDVAVVQATEVIILDIDKDSYSQTVVTSFFPETETMLISGRRSETVFQLRQVLSRFLLNMLEFYDYDIIKTKGMEPRTFYSRVLYDQGSDHMLDGILQLIHYERS